MAKRALEYTGQTTAELLACGSTHEIGSILRAFEWGIQGKSETTEEEQTMLALMTLQREATAALTSSF